jgi:hypothetical protein
MGFLDSLFGDKPTPKAIDKQMLRVKERYAQPEYRREAMDKLLAWGTPEALRAVLARFTVVVQSPHWDEEEKRWLVDELAAHGEPAKKALQEFLAKEDSVAFAAQALRKLSSSQEQWTADMVDALHARPADDHRTTLGKAELIAQLKDQGGVEVVTAVLPYLADHADDVQMATIDCLDQHAASLPEGQRGDVATKLAAVIVDDTRSARVLRHAARAMARLRFAIDATKPLAPVVAEDFVVVDGKLVAARPS